MNVLFLSELFYPHGGGAELATYLYANILANKNFNIIVVTNNNTTTNTIISKKDNLVIYRLNLLKANNSIKYSILSKFDILFSNFMRKMIKWADIVYIPRFWFSAIPLAKAFGKPVILHLHDYIPLCPLSNLYNASKKEVCNKKNYICSRCIHIYERNSNRSIYKNILSVGLNITIGKYICKLIELADAIICVSKEQRNIIIKKKPFLSSKIRVIYNPIHYVNKKIKIEGKDFGYFGGPNYLKGFHVLIEAMKMINLFKGKSIQIHATKFPDSYIQNNRRFLNKLSINPYNKLNEDKYNSVYRQVQTVIVPSIWPEPWPYVVIEALLRGRFLIASSVGGIPEQIRGCKGVLLCEPGNHKQLAEAIKFAESLSMETKAELGLHNREIFLKRFNDETTLSKFISICEHLT